MHCIISKRPKNKYCGRLTLLSWQKAAPGSLGAGSHWVQPVRVTSWQIRLRRMRRQLQNFRCSRLSQCVSTYIWRMCISCKENLLSVCTAIGMLMLYTSGVIHIKSLPKCNYSEACVLITSSLLHLPGWSLNSTSTLHRLVTHGLKVHRPVLIYWRVRYLDLYTII